MKKSSGLSSWFSGLSAAGRGSDSGLPPYGRRAAAWFLDFFMWSLISAETYDRVSEGWFQSSMILFISFVLFFVPVAIWSRTFGKLLTGLVVVGVDGSKVTVEQAFLRWGTIASVFLGYTLGVSSEPAETGYSLLFILFLLYGSSLFGSRRSLSDFIAQTRVQRSGLASSYDFISKPFAYAFDGFAAGYRSIVSYFANIVKK